MAVSGKTAAPHEIPFFLGTDKPPDMAAVTKAMAERVHGQLDAIAPKQIVGGSAGKLLIVDKTGSTAFAAMKGDGTIDAEGNFQLGAGVVGTNELADGAGTEAKHADGSVTSRKLKPTRGIVYGSGVQLSLTGSYVTPASLKTEITVPIESKLSVRVTYQVQLIADAAEVITATGSIRVDEGVENTQTCFASTQAEATDQRARMTVPIHGEYEVLLAAGKHLIEGRLKSSGSGEASASPNGSILSYTLYAA